MVRARSCQRINSPRSPSLKVSHADRDVDTSFDSRQVVGLLRNYLSVPVWAQRVFMAVTIEKAARVGADREQRQGQPTQHPSIEAEEALAIGSSQRDAIVQQPEQVGSMGVSGCVAPANNDVGQGNASRPANGSDGIPRQNMVALDSQNPAEGLVVLDISLVEAFKFGVRRVCVSLTGTDPKTLAPGHPRNKRLEDRVFLADQAPIDERGADIGSIAANSAAFENISISKAPSDAMAGFDMAASALGRCGLSDDAVSRCHGAFVLGSCRPAKPGLLGGFGLLLIKGTLLSLPDPVGETFGRALG